MFVVDTNILIYAADRNSPFHDRSRAALERWRRQSAPWYLTWGVVYEFLRVVTHPRVFRSPWTVGEAWSFIEALLASPSLEILVPTVRHQAVATEVIGAHPDLAGNTLHDAETVILMTEHGIRTIQTRDTDFHRFVSIEPIDPTAAPGRKGP